MGGGGGFREDSVRVEVGVEKAFKNNAPRVVHVKYLLGLVEVNEIPQGSVPLSMTDDVEVKGADT